MIKVDELLCERIFKAIRQCKTEKDMLERVNILNKESLVRPPNYSTGNYTTFRNKNWLFAIDTMRGSIMLVDEDDLDFIREFGMPSVKGTKYVTKFVTRSVTTHMCIAMKHGVELNGRETPIHHLNGYAFDNRKSNLVVCNGEISHKYLHYNEFGKMINNTLKGNFDVFSIVTDVYLLNGNPVKIPKRYA